MQDSKERTLKSFLNPATEGNTTEKWQYFMERCKPLCFFPQPDSLNETLMKNFFRFNGNLIVLTPEDCGKKKVLVSRSMDILYPICSAGSNRSQVLYRLFVNHHCQQVVLPHGARNGYDPYVLCDLYSCFGPTPDTVYDKGFKEAMQVSKVPKTGQAVCKDQLSPDEGMRLWFDENYWSPLLHAQKNKRYLLFCMRDILNIVLYRLWEQNANAFFPLSHLTLIVLDVEDEASLAWTRNQELAPAYQNMYQMYESWMEFRN